MKEKSYMLALPGEQEPEGRMEVLRRLKNAPDFKVVTADTEDEGSLELTVEYKGNRYRALLYPTGFELPEFYRCQHLFPDVDIEVMEGGREWTGSGDDVWRRCAGLLSPSA